MKRKLIVANWKSHKKLNEVKEWFEKFSELVKMKAENQVVVAVSDVFVFEAKKLIEEFGVDQFVSLAVQDISPFPFGAYTGAVSAQMVKRVVEWAIVGHSERRRYFHETSQDVMNKVDQLVEVGIKPIVCVDKDYAKQQLSLIDEKITELVVAYEPLEAIGSGTPEKPEEAEKVLEQIKAMREGVLVLYGGSINESNAGEYLESFDGLLVGGASLDPKKFWGVCNA